MYISSYEIPQILASEPDSVPFILKRLETEKFEYVKSLALDSAKETFRTILKGYYLGELGLDQAAATVESRVQTPPGYRRIERWEERLIRSEASKIYTLGYGDYLLSQGEDMCFIPHNHFDESPDCQRLIAGRIHPIRDVQKNIYANYGQRMAAYPTVPLHANCRHIIMRVPK